MNKKQRHNYGMKNGHSPDAKGVVCVDFDGTLVPWGPLMNPDAEALPGAVETVQALKDAGWKIVIFTSRCSPTWHAASGERPEEQLLYVFDTLNRLRIPFDRVTSEKVPAQAYIDDKAIEFTGDNWKQIAERMLMK